MTLQISFDEERLKELVAQAARGIYKSITGEEPTEEEVETWLQEQQ